jgi:hypothetical protein
LNDAGQSRHHDVWMRDRCWFAVATAVLVSVLIAIPTLAFAPQAAEPLANRPHPTRKPKPTPTPVATLSPTPAVTPSPSPSPTPSPSPSPPPGIVTLVGAGDIADCSSSGDEATEQVLDGIPGTVFTAGDNVYTNGTSTEFTNCYDPSWGQQKARTRPAPGNHDYNTTGAAGYFGYFGAAAGDPAKGYYAYDLGAWRIYVLNSNCGVVSCATGSPQEQWLRADLAAGPRICVAAIWHHPRFSDGTHGNSTTVQPFWQALYDANADLVITGHDHDYQRWAAQTPTGTLDSARGIVEFVVGTGGESHYAFTGASPNRLAGNDTTFGVLRLDLSATGYAFRFMPVAGMSYSDSGTGNCH